MNRIGDYNLERELGRGAFGVVSKGHHRSRPTVPLAIKVVADRGNTDRLLIEPTLLLQLEHPNVVRLEDYFLNGNDLVLVMEFIDGTDLETCLKNGEQFDAEAVREILGQLASALSVAHEQNIVHRDR